MAVVKEMRPRDTTRKAVDVDTSSCIAREPLSKLAEDGTAAILNYNLPQSTTYEVVSLIQLDIPERLFKEKERKPPPDNYWDRFDREREKAELTPEQITGVLTGKHYTNVPEIMDLGLNVTAQELPLSSGVKFKAANIAVSTKTASFATTYIAHRIAQGDRPVLRRRPSGKQGLIFQPRPKGAKPAISIVLKMRMASYLGDYGAGQTLSTFSLLPGERTTIEIRDFRHNESTRTSSQSVLDSYSESAMEDLQTTIEESTSSSAESSGEATSAGGSGGNMEIGLDLGFIKIGAGFDSETTGGVTKTEALSEQVNTLNSAVSHHVQTADTQRQIEINTDISSTEVSETEKTVTRTLENINRSRVLNFVFRQLLQEYFTLTYLHGASLLYSNGYDTGRRTAPLHAMDGFLRSVLVDDKTVDQVRNEIVVQLCNIIDYTGTRVSFIEQVTEKNRNCVDAKQEEKPATYVRKRRDLRQTYRDKSVDGIILDATHRIVRTPALIVDGMLGGGALLDCYNQRLQEAASEGAELTNRKLEQQMAVIDGVTDPVEKGRLYNHVFGSCCPTPQEEEEA
jgi:hypothetical protein